MLHDGGFFRRGRGRSWGGYRGAVGKGVGERWREWADLERFGRLTDEGNGLPFDLWA